MVSFGTVLAEKRRHRRLSQAELSGASGVSQRHISFLESGRAAPGRKALTQIVEALALSKPEADQLLVAAGLASQRAPLDWHAPALAGARATIDLMLAKHTPYPAIACDRAGTILATNAGFDWALTAVGLTIGDWVNLHDLTLHPKGLTPHMINPEAIVPHTLRRLRMAATGVKAAATTLHRVAAYPIAAQFRHDRGDENYAGVLIERYRLTSGDIALISVTAAFGSPEDEIAQHIQIELFFPADAETESTFAALGSITP
jgi:transcriptional regulator with XRE-family HTH domain